MKLLDSKGILLGLDGEEGRCFMYPQPSLSNYYPSTTSTQMLYFGAEGLCYQSSTFNSCNTKRKMESIEGPGETGEGRTTRTYPNKSKRLKKENYPAMNTIKVRKDKLGDKITELQQLVSPFGKSDTASVLHEALGYIRFLHDQVQVLSSPYLKCLPSTGYLQEGRPRDLRSRGLCLVPVSSTENMPNDNGAHFWSPAIGSYLSLSAKR